jgi:hydrogenase small subunit
MKNISRRDFMRYCGMGAAALGLTVTDLGLLEKALANPNGPSVIWLQGSGCTGCSESFLNRISTSSPTTAPSVLIDAINLVYHPTLMALPGQDAVAQAEAAYNKGGYILAVEGGVPTAFGGSACWAWTYNGVEVTFESAVRELANKASKILCVGTCAAWGGIPAAPPNPAGIKGVKALTGRKTINIPGCPTHPDWIVWAVAQLLLNYPVTLDSYGRPTQFFSATVHDQCPRNGTTKATAYGVDNACLMDLGCRGPDTMANCPSQKWNNQANWCVDANAPCIGCTSPLFPGTNPFYTKSG